MIDIFDELLAYEQEQDDVFDDLLSPKFGVARGANKEEFERKNAQFANQIVNKKYSKKEIQAELTERKSPAQTENFAISSLQTGRNMTNTERIEQRKERDEATVKLINFCRIANWKTISRLYDEPRSTIISRLESLVKRKEIKKLDGGLYAKLSYNSNQQNKHNLLIASICAEITMKDGQNVITDAQMRNGKAEEWKVKSILHAATYIPDIVIPDKKTAIEIEISMKQGKIKTDELRNKIHGYRLSKLYDNIIYYTDSPRILKRLEQLKKETGIGDKMRIEMLDIKSYI